MFEIVLQSWKASLSALLPQRIKSVIIHVVKNYIKIVSITVSVMRWFFLADLFFTAVVAEAVAKKISGAGLKLIVGITDLNWFIIFGSIVVLLRKKEDLLDNKTYIKTMFFKYMHAWFIFILFEIMFLSIALMLGITKFPSVHWVIKIMVQIFELLVIFYWLDSNCRFADFAKSVEKTANLILYKLPILLIFFGMFIGLDHLLKLLTNTEYTPFLLDNSSTYLLQPTSSRFAELTLILVRYVKFAFEILWLCILFAFYDANKITTYSESIFEPKEENEGS